MRRERDRRGPKRRGFDDDNYAPQDTREARPVRAFGGTPRPFAMEGGPPVDATVKFFSPEKGFGFVSLSDGSGDAFLHVSVLQAAGHEAVPPGAKVRVSVGQGQKGRQVTAVLDVDATDAGPMPAPRTGSPGPRPARARPDPATAIPLRGTMKWFKADKGFGFAAAEDGGKDVFVHISVLEKAGLANLAEGQSVAMRVVDAPKGREAVSISLAE